MNEAFRRARERKKCSLARLSMLAGIGESTLRDWEAGRTMPTVYNAILVCDALEISLDEYVGREFQPQDNKKRTGN